MSDVADILGKQRKKEGKEEEEAGESMLTAARAAGRGGRSTGQPRTVARRRRRPKGMSRELYNLVADPGAMPSMVPTQAGNTTSIRSKRHKKVTRWAWKPFTSSARRDSLELGHWVRANAEFPDYPFARFAKKVEVVRYTEDEYKRLLTPPAGANSMDLDARWPKDHTDLLMDLCRRFDLRWPVIHDRFDLRPQHNVEDMKLRFYTVMARMLEYESSTSGKETQSQYYQFRYRPEDELKGRRRADQAFRLTPAALSEEKSLLRELQAIDTQLDKLRGANPESIDSVVLSLAQKRDKNGLNFATPEGAVSSDERIRSGDLSAARTNEMMSSSASAAIVHLDHQQAVALRGEPRGGVKLWQSKTGQSPGWDPMDGFALRSEQMMAPPDAMRFSSETFPKVTGLLGELGLPHPHKLFPCAATLTALTAVRRAAASMIQLQKAVRLREQQVVQLQWRRKSMSAILLTHEPALPTQAMVEQQRALDARRRQVELSHRARAEAAQRMMQQHSLGADERGPAEGAAMPPPPPQVPMPQGVSAQEADEGTDAEDGGDTPVAGGSRKRRAAASARGAPRSKKRRIGLR